MENVRFQRPVIAIVGAGAVNSLTTDLFAADGIEIHVFDDDDVEDANIGLSAFHQEHVGMSKAHALCDLLRDKYNIQAFSHRMTITSKEDIMAVNPTLVIDGLDNVESRLFTHGLGVDTVHVGVSHERHGEVVWDEHYVVPDTYNKRGEGEVICTRAAGKKIIRFVSVVAAQIIEEYLDEGTKRTVLVTEELKVL